MVNLEGTLFEEATIWEREQGGQPSMGSRGPSVGQRGVGVCRMRALPEDLGLWLKDRTTEASRLVESGGSVARPVSCHHQPYPDFAH